ncbi:hypothetical protein [Nocardia sp. XZ_19_231]|uniref:hypothetical protein n=1 Tax=Nocardia sp. XZ_19_231 TaxID=2769252 RepID=UPI001E54A053|nr:hypothetical protein [Nocardia sp. XZ_19_231]
MTLSGEQLQQTARETAADKQHWISVGAGRGVTKRLVEDLVHDSYDLAAGPGKRS